MQLHTIFNLYELDPRLAGFAISKYLVVLHMQDALCHFVILSSYLFNQFCSLSMFCSNWDVQRTEHNKEVSGQHFDEYRQDDFDYLTIKNTNYI